MARCFPLGVQPDATSRSSRDADTGQRLAQERALLQPGSSALGVSAKCMGAEGRLPGNGRSARAPLADRQNTGWREGHDPAHRRTLPGLLLLHPRPRNQPFDPAFDDRRTLDRNSRIRPKPCKGCPETTWKACHETEQIEMWGTRMVGESDMGHPPLQKYFQNATHAICLMRSPGCAKLGLWERDWETYQ